MKVGFFSIASYISLQKSTLQDYRFNLRTYFAKKFFLHPLVYISTFEKPPEPKVAESFYVCLWLENLVCETLVSFCYFCLLLLFNEQNKNPLRRLAELLNLFQITTFLFLFSACYVWKTWGLTELYFLTSQFLNKQAAFLPFPILPGRAAFILAAWMTYYCSHHRQLL